MSNNNNNNHSESIASVECRIKTPQRVLHFSDGVLEDFDENEEDIDNTDSDSNKQLIVSDKFPFITMITRSVLWFGINSLKVCDYIGESLANFFGITSPKYQYEIEEYNRIIEEENYYEVKHMNEFSGWNRSSDKNGEINTIIELENNKF